jgi:hypothetical protein
MSAGALELRQAVAAFLAHRGAADELHALAAHALADAPVDSPDGALIHRLYGLLTDFHAGLLSHEELRAELLPFVTSYSFSWPLMAPVAAAETGANNQAVAFSPNPRPSLRFFEQSPEAVSA